MSHMKGTPADGPAQVVSRLWVPNIHPRWSELCTISLARTGPPRSRLIEIPAASEIL
jgi:hypothetical protein